MRKRVLSLALALMMVLTLIPAALAAGADTPERGVLTYSEVIAPQYEDAGQFSEDLAAVKKDGKWGYIDHDNNVVIPFQYELAYDFSEGYAVVAKSSRQEVYNEGTDWESTSTYYEMGFIDKAGKYTPFIVEDYDWETKQQALQNLEVPDSGLNTQVGYFFWNGYCVLGGSLFRPDGSEVELLEDTENEGVMEYIPIGPVTEGLVPVQEMMAGWANPGWADPATGKVVKSFDDTEYFGPAVGQGNQTLHSYRAVAYTNPFNQGVAPVQVYVWNAETDEESWLWGIMDRNYQWVIEPQFTFFVWRDDSDAVHEVFGDTGLAMVQNKEGKCGAIDKTGAVKIPFEYDLLLPVAEGLITFEKDGKVGYLDAATLAVVIPAQYEKGSSFNMGMAVVYDGAKAFLIDRKGNPIPGADALNAEAYFKGDEESGEYIYTPEEYVVIEKNGKYGYGHIEYLQSLPEKDEMHDWAYEEVVAAIENDLVPSYLQNLYLNDIKRGEFCDVIIQALEAVLDQNIAQIVLDKTGEDITNYQHTYPFVDTADTNTLAANKLGIVNGKGNGRFDPYANITRQEAATMLMRAAKVLELNGQSTGNSAFADSEQVAAWAAEAVDYICKAGIMNGKGDNFDPTGSYSREQSFMTIYRLFQQVVEQN